MAQNGQTDLSSLLGRRSEIEASRGPGSIEGFLGNLLERGVNKLIGDPQAEAQSAQFLATRAEEALRSGQSLKEAGIDIAPIEKVLGPEAGAYFRGFEKTDFFKEANKKRQSESAQQESNRNILQALIQQVNGPVQQPGIVPDFMESGGGAAPAEAQFIQQVVQTPNARQSQATAPGPVIDEQGNFIEQGAAPPQPQPQAAAEGDYPRIRFTGGETTPETERSVVNIRTQPTERPPNNEEVLQRFRALPEADQSFLTGMQEIGRQRLQAREAATSEKNATTNVNQLEDSKARTKIMGEQLEFEKIQERLLNIRTKRAGEAADRRSIFESLIREAPPSSNKEDLRKASDLIARNRPLPKNLQDALSFATNGGDPVEIRAQAKRLSDAYGLNIDFISAIKGRSKKANRFLATEIDGLNQKQILGVIKNGGDHKKASYLILDSEPGEPKAVPYDALPALKKQAIDAIAQRLGAQRSNSGGGTGETKEQVFARILGASAARAQGSNAPSAPPAAQRGELVPQAPAPGSSVFRQDQLPPSGGFSVQMGNRRGG